METIHVAQHHQPAGLHQSSILLSTTFTATTYLLATTLLITLVLLPTLYERIQHDYKAFLALGPGAIPSTFSGYLKMSILRQFRLRSPYVPPPIPPTLWLRRGHLESLPPRKGPRPLVAGIAPQRQITQHGPPGTYESVSHVLTTFAASHPSQTYLGRSTFERHNMALFSRCCHPSPSSTSTTTTSSSSSPPEKQPNLASLTRYFGEICHAHPADSGSMHLTLHPADVGLVLATGWGERHPLARSNWWWRWFAPVPAGFTMVYAPRDERELRIISDIVRAAAWWVGGIDPRIGA